MPCLFPPFCIKLNFFVFFSRFINILKYLKKKKKICGKTTAFKFLIDVIFERVKTSFKLRNLEKKKKNFQLIPEPFSNAISLPKFATGGVGIFRRDSSR